MDARTTEGATLISGSPSPTSRSRALLEHARALDAVGSARILVAGSPVYRATYSGLLKVFFDLLPPDSFMGKIAVPILTGGNPAHQLALDHGFRPLFASLGAVVATGVYGWDGQFTNGPEPALLARIDRAVDEALALRYAGSPPSAETFRI